MTLDGGPRTYLQTDDERRAVKEGRMVAFVDEGRLGVECEVYPGEFGVNLSFICPLYPWVLLLTFSLWSV